MQVQKRGVLTSDHNMLNFALYPAKPSRSSNLFDGAMGALFESSRSAAQQSVSSALCSPEQSDDVCGNRFG